ncbi:MAG: hypothetical protein AB1796_01610 [Bacillota bacterium]
MEIAILAGAGILAGCVLARHLLGAARSTGCLGCGQVCQAGCRGERPLKQL